MSQAGVLWASGLHSTLQTSVWPTCETPIEVHLKYPCSRGKGVWGPNQLVYYSSLPFSPSEGGADVLLATPYGSQSLSNLLLGENWAI